METDVLVCGGGCAGLGAALAAARNGAKVILVERPGFAGGIITAPGPPLRRRDRHRLLVSRHSSELRDTRSRATGRRFSAGAVRHPVSQRAGESCQQSVGRRPLSFSDPRGGEFDTRDGHGDGVGTSRWNSRRIVGGTRLESA